MLRESRCNNDTIDCWPPRLGILTTRTIARRGPPLARARARRPPTEALLSPRQSVSPAVSATHAGLPFSRQRSVLADQRQIKYGHDNFTHGMPTSMTASHGGVLYYVVKVPKDDPTLDYVSATASHKYLEEKRTLSPLNLDSDGWDNPFRPDGDLSKEADQIVELIKEGKPITPTPTSATSPLLPADHSGPEVNKLHDQQQPVTSTPTKANGTCNEKNAVPPNVEVQRGTVINGNEPSQVEHVILKKKPKCRCCVIQ